MSSFPRFIQRSNLYLPEKKKKKRKREREKLTSTAAVQAKQRGCAVGEAARQLAGEAVRQLVNVARVAEPKTPPVRLESVVQGRERKIEAQHSSRV